MPFASLLGGQQAGDQEGGKQEIHEQVEGGAVKEEGAKKKDEQQAYQQGEESADPDGGEWNGYVIGQARLPLQCPADCLRFWRMGSLLL